MAGSNFFHVKNTGIGATNLWTGTHIYLQDDDICHSDTSSVAVSNQNLIHSSKSLVPSPTWIIPDEVLIRIQRLAISEYEIPDRPREFLKMLYQEQTYISHFTDSRLDKRGANALNWKNDKKFICDSLHKANNIYQSLGKRSWQKMWPENAAGTWPSLTPPPIIPYRCIEITKFTNSQCKRSSKSPNARWCTQHFKMHYPIHAQ